MLESLRFVVAPPLSSQEVTDWPGHALKHTAELFKMDVSQFRLLRDFHLRGYWEQMFCVYHCKDEQQRLQPLHTVTSATVNQTEEG